MPRPGQGNVLHEGVQDDTRAWRQYEDFEVSFDVIFDVLTSFSRQFPQNVSMSTDKRGTEPNIYWSKKCSYFSVKAIVEWRICKEKSL